MKSQKTSNPNQRWDDLFVEKLLVVVDHHYIQHLLLLQTIQHNGVVLKHHPLISFPVCSAVHFSQRLATMKADFALIPPYL